MSIIASTLVRSVYQKNRPEASKKVLPSNLVHLVKLSTASPPFTDLSNASLNVIEKRIHHYMQRGLGYSFKYKNPQATQEAAIIVPLCLVKPEVNTAPNYPQAEGQGVLSVLFTVRSEGLREHHGEIR